MNRTRFATLTIALASLIVAACTAAAAPAPTAPPTAITSPSPTESQRPSLTPTPSPAGPAAITWHRGGILPGATEQSSAVAVVETHDGYLAVGLAGFERALVWTSSDGRAWTAAAPDPDLATAAIADVVAVGDRLIAVGRDVADIDRDLAGVWMSEDGDAANWRRVRAGEEFEGAQLIDVVATDEQLVAVGGVPGADAAAVWTSRDGRTWRRSPAADVFDHAFLWAVAEGGPGFVAVGWRRNPEPDLAIWTSEDGSHWTLASDVEGGAGYEGRDVVAFEDHMVVVGGNVFERGARAWVSDDHGLTWQQAADSQDLADGSMTRVLAVPGGLMAFGGAGRDDAGVWTSTEGRTWTPMRDGRSQFADAFVVDAIASDRGVLLAGVEQKRIPGSESYDSWATTWLGAWE